MLSKKYIRTTPEAPLSYVVALGPTIVGTVARVTLKQAVATTFYVTAVTENTLSKTKGVPGVPPNPKHVITASSTTIDLHFVLLISTVKKSAKKSQKIMSILVLQQLGDTLSTPKRIATGWKTCGGSRSAGGNLLLHGLCDETVYLPAPVVLTSPLLLLDG